MIGQQGIITAHKNQGLQRPALQLGVLTRHDSSNGVGQPCKVAVFKPLDLRCVLEVRQRCNDGRIRTHSRVHGFGSCFEGKKLLPLQPGGYEGLEASPGYSVEP